MTVLLFPDVQREPDRGGQRAAAGEVCRRRQQEEGCLQQAAGRQWSNVAGQQ